MSTTSARKAVASPIAGDGTRRRFPPGSSGQVRERLCTAEARADGKGPADPDVRRGGLCRAPGFCRSGRSLLGPVGAPARVSRLARPTSRRAHHHAPGARGVVGSCDRAASIQFSASRPGLGQVQLRSYHPRRLASSGRSATRARRQSCRPPKHAAEQDGALVSHRAVDPLDRCAAPTGTVRAGQRDRLGPFQLEAHLIGCRRCDRGARPSSHHSTFGARYWSFEGRDPIQYRI